MANQSVVAAPTSLAPFKVGVFRMLWIASLVSTIGSWMQTVGAQWLLVEEGSPAFVVALVQSAASAPVLLLAIPAGVLGEFVNRRTVLIVVQVFQLLVAAGLAWLTAVDLMSPALLLTLTFILGAAAAFQLPAYQALVPEIVPAPLIQNAAVLSSVEVNVARAIGPAVAGLVVAQLGVTWVFVLNAVSFGVFLLVLLTWHSYRPKRGRPERFLDATRAGLRYVIHARVVRGLYLRLALFLIPANALWALLPLIASAELGLDAGGYGLLLGAIGAGSVGGAFLLSWTRAHWGTNTTIAVSSAVFGGGSIAIVLAPNIWVAVPTLLASGVAWIGVLATINGTVQAFLPVWVRTRGLSIYQLVLFGATAIGAALMGMLADLFGLVPVMVGAGLAMVALAAAGLLRPAVDTAGIGRSIVPIPLTDVPPVREEPADEDEDDGAVLVLVRYRVPLDRRDDFVAQMGAVERSRRRTGARWWDLYTDREDPGILVESFTVGSWQEHLSQHFDRSTEYDSGLLTAARKLSTREPTVEHLISARRSGSSGRSHPRRGEQR
jgi:MFS family permease